jgi:hypothetical protein
MPSGNQPTIRRNVRPAMPDGKRDLSGRPKGTVEWAEINNQLLRDCLCAVTSAGAAIMFGRTSDGGALSITVLDGEQRVKEYPHSVDDAEATLSWLVSMYTVD